MSGRTLLVLGCGSIGARRAMIAAQYLKADERLLLYDADPDRALALADLVLEQCIRPPFVTQVSAPDLAVVRSTHVLLATPPAVRSVALRRCALDTATKILVEKPLALTLGAVRDLLEVVPVAANVRVVANMQFHPEVERVLGFARDRRPDSAALWMRQDYTKAYHNGECGVVLDSIHELGLARDIMGPISGIAGLVAKRYGRSGDGRLAAYVVAHADGGLSEVSLSLISTWPDRGLQLRYPDYTVTSDRAAMIDPRNIACMYQIEMSRFLSGDGQVGQSLHEAEEVLRWALRLIHGG